MLYRRVVSYGAWVFLLVVLGTWSGPAPAQDRPAELERLRNTVELLIRQDRVRQRELAALKQELAKLRESEPAHHSEGSAPAEKKGSVFASKMGDTVVRLNSIGVNVAGVGGYSSERETTTRALQAGSGGHDPDKTGFTLQAADFSMTGSVDDYFDGELHIAYFLDEGGESKVELEEAFLRTNSLPHGFDIEAGQSFLEFGAFNPSHLHDWVFIDQPVVNTRMFGGDGIRQTGVRVGWQVPGLPLDLHGGLYNAKGETMKSFFATDEALGGVGFVSQDVSGFSDLVYLGRAATHASFGKGANIDFGVSALGGPNATGSDGRTNVVGADLGVGWTLRGGRALRWQTEFMYRDYDIDDVSGLSGVSLEDYGLYTHLLFDFMPRWSAGLRLDYASGTGDGTTAKDTDDDRSDRYRISPMIRWAFAPLADLRLQYNYDDMDSLDATPNDGKSHAVWLGLRFGFGAGGEFAGIHDHGAGHGHNHN